MSVRRVALATVLAGITIGVGGAAVPPPRPCHRGPTAAEFASNYLRPYIYARAFNSPKWQPTDFNICSVPVGDSRAADEFMDSLQTILPEPYHTWHPDLGIGPGDPHDGPYWSELRQGVRDSGFFIGRVLRLSQFRNGNGALLSFMLAPDGTRGMEPDQGSSPDFAEGPIISNSIMPITVDSVTSHNSMVYSMPYSAMIPALDSKLSPPFDVDGHSHIPVFISESADRSVMPMTPIEHTGTYRMRIHLEDAEQRGWNIDVWFVIVQPYQ